MQTTLSNAFIRFESLYLIQNSLQFFHKILINNMPSLNQIMARCRSGDKPLSGSVMPSLLTHVNVTQPRWARDLCMFKKQIYICIYIYITWTNNLNTCRLLLSVALDNWQCWTHYSDNRWHFQVFSCMKTENLCWISFGMVSRKLLF